MNQDYYFENDIPEIFEWLEASTPMEYLTLCTPNMRTQCESRNKICIGCRKIRIEITEVEG